MWRARWLGYQLSRVAPLFFRWRGSPPSTPPSRCAPACELKQPQSLHVPCKPVLACCWEMQGCTPPIRALGALLLESPSGCSTA